MYTFADYYGIKELQSMALRKLHRLLVQAPLQNWALQSFLELVHYTYSNTRPRKYDGLRVLVGLYGAILTDRFGYEWALSEGVSDLPEEFISDVKAKSGIAFI